MEKQIHIAMVDIWSVSTENGKPIGHGCKVGNEYYDYIKGSFEVIQYVNKSILSYVKNPNRVSFRKSLIYRAGKIQRIVTNFQCLFEIYKKEKIIWFYIPDIYLFLFILLIPKGSRKLAVNVYEDYSTNHVKHWIFVNALKKMNVVFVTNKYLLPNITNGVLISDYAYDEAIYSNYIITKKKNRVVCLGTMNEKKQLFKAVEAFKENGYPLYIIGQFSNTETFKMLCEKKTNNIVIENRYIEEKEYYHLMGSSRFCLIPYDPVFYKNRTSGVMQECLFLDTIPISHNQILRFSNIPGVGYDDLTDLAKLDITDIQTKEIIRYYGKERKTFYGYEVIQKKVIDALNNI